jgi:hypothetical protein
LRPIDLVVAGFYFKAISQHRDGPTVEVAPVMGLLYRWKHGTHEGRIVNGVLHDEESGLNSLAPDLCGSWPTPTSDVGLEPGRIGGILPRHCRALGGVDNSAYSEALADGLIGSSTLRQLVTGLSEHYGGRLLSALPAAADQHEKEKLTRGGVQSRVLAAIA